MKENKNYKNAKLVHKEMYVDASSISSKKKKELYTKYLKLIRKAAYVGYAEAQYELGQQYENTSYLYIENPSYNPKKCIYWYKKASEKNHAAASNNLAFFYETGKGCKKNLKKALLLYKKSADLGDKIGRENYKIMLKQLKE